MEFIIAVITSGPFIYGAIFWSIVIFLLPNTGQYSGPESLVGKVAVVIVLSLINVFFFDVGQLP